MGIKLGLCARLLPTMRHESFMIFSVIVCAFLGIATATTEALPCSSSGLACNGTLAPACCPGLKCTESQGVHACSSDKSTMLGVSCIKSGQPCNPSGEDLCCKDQGGTPMQCVDMGQGYECISGLGASCIKSGQPCNPSGEDLCCKDPAGTPMQCVDMGQGYECISGVLMYT